MRPAPRLDPIPPGIRQHRTHPAYTGMLRRTRAVSQFLRSGQDRAMWFSLRENHASVLRPGTDNCETASPATSPPRPARAPAKYNRQARCPLRLRNRRDPTHRRPIPPERRPVLPLACSQTTRPKPSTTTGPAAKFLRFLPLPRNLTTKMGFRKIWQPWPSTRASSMVCYSPLSLKAPRTSPRWKTPPSCWS